MRIPKDFPTGFGSDPTLMFGPPSDASPPVVPDTPQAATPPNEVPLEDTRGSVHALYDTRLGSELHAAPGSVRLGARGFHLGTDRSVAEEPSRRREPQSFVIPTLIVGAILAAVGYFLDLR